MDYLMPIPFDCPYKGSPYCNPFSYRVHVCGLTIGSIKTQHRKYYTKLHFILLNIDNYTVFGGCLPYRYIFFEEKISFM